MFRIQVCKLNDNNFCFSDVAMTCGLQNIPGLENVTQMCASFPSYYSNQQCIHYYDRIPSSKFISDVEFCIEKNIWAGRL